MRLRAELPKVRVLELGSEVGEFSAHRPRPENGGACLI